MFYGFVHLSNEITNDVTIFRNYYIHLSNEITNDVTIFRNYYIQQENAKRKGHFVAIIPVFLNYLEHSNHVYKEQNIENLVYIQEGEYILVILQNLQAQHPFMNNTHS